MPAEWGEELTRKIKVPSPPSPPPGDTRRLRLWRFCSRLPTSAGPRHPPSYLSGMEIPPPYWLLKPTLDHAHKPLTIRDIVGSAIGALVICAMLVTFAVGILSGVGGGCGRGDEASGAGQAARAACRMD